MAPAMRRDADELDGFLEFLAAEIAHPGLRATVARFVDDEALRAALRAPAGGARRTTPTRAGCSSTPSASRRSAARRRSCTRGCGPTCVLAAALLHDVGRDARARSAARRSAPTDEGRLLGHVHLGLRLVEERAAALETEVRAELLHAVAVPPRRARRAHGRGGGALPREPARRDRRDAAGRVAAALGSHTLGAVRSQTRALSRYAHSGRRVEPHSPPIGWGARA